MSKITTQIVIHFTDNKFIVNLMMTQKKIVENYKKTDTETVESRKQ